MKLRLFSREHRTFGILIARITDLSRRISEEEYRGMPHFLELSELHEWDHMSEMDLGGNWIDPELDDELISSLETFLKMGLIDDARDSFFEEICE